MMTSAVAVAIVAGMLVGLIPPLAAVFRRELPEHMASWCLMTKGGVPA